MHRRIFRSFAVLVLASVAVLAVAFGLLFMNRSQNHEKEAIREKAHFIAGLLNHGSFESYNALRVGDTRITLISPRGVTLYDSYAGADITVDRGDRTEFIRAAAHGNGEAVRPSDTFGADTFYYAVRLADGRVLRLSRTLNNLNDVFSAMLPMLTAVTLAIVCAAYFLTSRLTRRIVKPLADADFERTDEMPYEEIVPFMQKINAQRQEITGQIHKLKNRAETIDAIISNMREGMVMVNAKGNVMTVNQSALDIFGIPKKKLVVDKNIRHICRDAEFMRCVELCLAGEYTEIAVPQIIKNTPSGERSYNAILSPVKRGGVNDGAIVFFLDVTEQRKAEAQRREFTANVSHELKTPLTSVSAMSEMMANGMVKDGDTAVFADRISRQINRLALVIDDIIRLSEFDEGKAARDFTLFDIFDMAQTIIEAFKDKAKEKNVSISLEGYPVQINANSRLIEELLYNLIDNGIKYNRENGSVTLYIREDGERCILSVSDTGIGIPPEHQPRVFERFYRVDASRSKQTGGTGLGLSIVKHIAEHHGGKISLESAENKGTKIEITLAKR
ncbi:MAG: ATP-binding protein [Defluviitaleaceae bacterium]|nr:ATP-binding protein [Defluviitaleaceae bacterium]